MITDTYGMILSHLQQRDAEKSSQKPPRGPGGWVRFAKMPAGGIGAILENHSKNSLMARRHRRSAGAIFENRFIDAFQGLICEEEKQGITDG